MKDELRTVLIDECKELELAMLSLEIMPDHLHLFVGAKPTYIPSVIVKQLKGVSSIRFGNGSLILYTWDTRGIGSSFHICGHVGITVGALGMFLKIR